MAYPILTLLYKSITPSALKRSQENNSVPLLFFATLPKVTWWFHPSQGRLHQPWPWRAAPTGGLVRPAPTADCSLLVVVGGGGGSSRAHCEAARQLRANTAHNRTPAVPLTYVLSLGPHKSPAKGDSITPTL